MKTERCRKDKNQFDIVARNSNFVASTLLRLVERIVGLVAFDKLPVRMGLKATHATCTSRSRKMLSCILTQACCVLCVRCVRLWKSTTKLTWIRRVVLCAFYRRLEWRTGRQWANDEVRMATGRVSTEQHQQPSHCTGHTAIKPPQYVTITSFIHSFQNSTQQLAF